LEGDGGEAENAEEEKALDGRILSEIFLNVRVL
jgi:hypothetical protein